MASQGVSKEQQNEDTLRSVEVFIRLGLIFGLMIWCFQILSPFLPTIVWALVIAAALLPAFNWFKAKIRRGPGMSATIFTLIILTAILTPSFMLSGTLINTAQEYAKELEDGSLQVPPPPERVKNLWLVGERLHATWGLASENLEAALEQFESQIRKAANWLLRTAAGAGLGILQFALAVAISGVFLAYQESGSGFARRLGGRLAGAEGERFASMASSTVRSVAQGVLGVAVIQAIMAGILLMVYSVPGAGLWTLLILILATVQLPTILVLLPTMIYVGSVNDLLPTVIFVILALAVGLSDNILKPILLGRGSSQPMLVIFLGAIGGFILNGIVGLFVGAVILALGYDLFMLWLNQGKLEHMSGGVAGE